MSKYTPGPWSIVGNTVCAAGDYNEGIAIPMEWPVWSRKTAEANARLIAAAPELLEACRALMDWSVAEENFTGDFWSRVALWEDARAKCLAALAKAEG